MTIHPRTIATRARRRLQTVSAILDLIADEGPAAVARAQQWAAGPTGASGRTGSKSTGDKVITYGDPTGGAVVAGGGAHAAREVAAIYTDLVLVRVLTGQLTVVAERLEASLKRYRVYTADLPTPGVESLEDLNRTDGLCPTCRKTTCTGRGDDRLRRITVAESTQRLMCNACRVAWSRRPYDDVAADGTPQLETYDTFRTERQRGTT